MTTILSSRDLLQVEGTFSGIKVMAEVQAEAGIIKDMSKGSLFKEEVQIGTFECVENRQGINPPYTMQPVSLPNNGQLNIKVYKDGFDNLVAVCTAISLFMADVQTKIAE